LVLLNSFGKKPKIKILGLQKTLMKPSDFSHEANRNDLIKEFGRVREYQRSYIYAIEDDRIN